MIARRDLMIGGVCAAAAATAATLRPRREAPLLKGMKMADVVPPTFGGWISQDVGDPLAVNGEGTLSEKLYNELVVRTYTNAGANTQITMLLAYGGRQSDELQLHRPEVCYPAFGYDLVRNDPVALPVAGRVKVPARRLLAQADGRRESVIYWSRIGEMLPQDGSQQRSMRLKIAMEGIIPDGLLSRFSIVGDYPEYDWQTIAAFIAELVLAIQPDKRSVLVGTERANLLRGIPSVAPRP